MSDNEIKSQLRNNFVTLCLQNWEWHFVKNYNHINIQRIQGPKKGQSGNILDT